MGLRESRVINGVHPWLGVRLKWMEQVADIVGSKQSLFSGFRTIEQQRILYDTVASGRPVAFPGCSQHNYGFAADGSWLIIVQITSKGRPRSIGPSQTIAFMNSAARHVGLHVVANDTGHFQVYPGLQFKAWAVAQGLCNPNPPTPRWILEQEALDRFIDDMDFLGFVGRLP